MTHTAHIPEHQTASLLAKAAIVLMPIAIMFSRSLAELAVVLVGVLFLVRSYRTKEWAWVKEPWFIAALVFTAYLTLISAPMAVHPEIALPHSLFFIRWPLFAAALAYWVFASPELRRWFEVTIAAIVVFIIADSLLQYFTGSDIFGKAPHSTTRLTGPFDRPVPGTYTLRIIFIALAALYFSHHLKNDLTRNITLLAALSIGAAFMFLTGERVAFMSFLLGSGIVILALTMTQKRGRLWILLGGALLAIAIAGALATQSKMVERTIGSTASTIGNFWESPYGRLYDNALMLWRDAPWTGVGIKNYRPICKDVTQDPSIEGWFCSHPHNTYVEILAEGGLIGVLLFSTMLALILWHFLKAIPRQAMTAGFAIALFLATFWPIMSTMSITSGWIAAIIWMGMGWAINVTRGEG
ncbi:O-antigen ligase family protein [Thioalkalivibrio sulfidiphilus]|uniref:O-antigen ligase family protein n=1 Tax=Thioalkalivibrio sulfidiphilus TaxID=1033854 RepID=UPI003B328681